MTVHLLQPDFLTAIVCLYSIVYFANVYVIVIVTCLNACITTPAAGSSVDDEQYYETPRLW